MCSTCGEYFKGERGLAIHKGHARRNGTKCADSPSRGETAEHAQVSPYSSSRPNSIAEIFQEAFAQTACGESSVLCSTCGEYFKGEHGLAIHKGHARRNGSKCAEGLTRRERDEHVQLNPYLFGGAIGQVQVNPYLLGGAIGQVPMNPYMFGGLDLGYDTFHGVTSQSAYNTVSSENSVLCSTCGRSFKGQHGLAIHKGHARRNGSMCGY